MGWCGAIGLLRKRKAWHVQFPFDELKEEKNRKSAELVLHKHLSLSLSEFSYSAELNARAIFNTEAQLGTPVATAVICAFCMHWWQLLSCMTWNYLWHHIYLRLASEQICCCGWLTTTCRTKCASCQSLNFIKFIFSLIFILRCTSYSN